MTDSRRTTESINPPEGWCQARLLDVTDRVLNIHPEEQPRRQYRYADISSIDNLRNRVGDLKCFLGKDAPSRARRPVQAGDILFSNVRTYLRNVALLEGDALPDVCSTGFTVLRSNGAILPSYLLRYVLTNGFTDRVSQTQTGTHYPATSDRAVLAESVPLPPLPEQKRIVALLDSVFAKLDSSRDRLDRLPALLKRFRKSVLLAAVAGELTNDWRATSDPGEPASKTIARLKELHATAGTGQRRNAALPSEDAHDLDAASLPKTWEVIELQWLCAPDRPITYGILKPGPHHSDGVAYVRVADYPAGRIILEGVRRTTRAIADAYKRSTLRAGDVLLAIRGTFGRVCRVPKELDGANITQDTARLSIHPLVDADYVKLFLRSPDVQHRLGRAAKGVAVRGVNIGDIRALQVALPSAREQREVVRRVRALLDLADKIERRVAESRGRGEALRSAVLTRTFQGELVQTEAELAASEGRPFESAADMLKRIQATRDYPSQPSRTRRPWRRRGFSNPSRP